MVGKLRARSAGSPARMRAWPQFRSIVPSVQCSGRASTISSTWPSGDETLQAVEEAQPRSSVRVGRLDADPARAMGQGAIGPDVAVAAVVGLEVQAMPVVRPGRFGIGLGGDGPELIEAENGAAGGRVGVEPDDGPLLSAIYGSSLSNQAGGFY
jgi:hypothetical protein